jgi:hypothetical protein
MPLACIQTDRPIRVADGGFFVAERFNDNVICPLAQATVADIPAAKQRPKSCEELGDYLGVDISSGLSVPDPDKPGEFKTNHISSGTFRFSVSRETMYRHLGELVTQFPERMPPQKKARVA